MRVCRILCQPGPRCVCAECDMIDGDCDVGDVCVCVCDVCVCDVCNVCVMRVT